MSDPSDPIAEFGGPESRPEFKSVRVGGVRIDDLDQEMALESLLVGAPSRAVHLCNAYTIALASQDSDLLAVLERSALNLADGAPVAILAQRGGAANVRRQVSGPDLMAACLDGGRRTDTRHYLFGSTSDVVAQLETRIESTWPGALIVGVECPPFGELNDEDLLASNVRFEAVKADLVWVGLGTPKQDFVVDRLSRIGGATFVAIGAGFDFLAGTKKRAPRWMRRTGLEWLFRLSSEPRRLWRRYLFGNVRFLIAVVRNRNHRP